MEFTKKDNSIVTVSTLTTKKTIITEEEDPITKFLFQEKAATRKMIPHRSKMTLSTLPTCSYTYGQWIMIK
jgi:hypothetical protein